jgi:uncharacterized protein
MTGLDLIGPIARRRPEPALRGQPRARPGRAGADNDAWTLGYLARLREGGHVVANGPVDGQPDPSLRGLAFYRTGSLERSRKLAEADPAVRAGRLAVEIMTWYCPPGTMSRPGRAVTLS